MAILFVFIAAFGILENGAAPANPDQPRRESTG
jgi:hypothetical protein